MKKINLVGCIIIWWYNRSPYSSNIPRGLLLIQLLRCSVLRSILQETFTIIVKICCPKNSSYPQWVGAVHHSKGTFLNYVEQILPFIDHLPTPN